MPAGEPFTGVAMGENLALTVFRRFEDEDV
jgi:hypothetical protein